MAVFTGGVLGRNRIRNQKFLWRTKLFSSTMCSCFNVFITWREWPLSGIIIAYTAQSGRVPTLCMPTSLLVMILSMNGAWPLISVIGPCWSVLSWSLWHRAILVFQRLALWLVNAIKLLAGKSINWFIGKVNELGWNLSVIFSGILVWIRNFLCPLWVDDKLFVHRSFQLGIICSAFHCQSMTETRIPPCLKKFSYPIHTLGTM